MSYTEAKVLKGSDNVLLSRNSELQEFLHNFYYHNVPFFQNCIDQGITKCPDNLSDEDTPSIYYEKGPWKWGSQGMQNKCERKGFIKVLREDYDTSCLAATPKLVNKILNAINC